MIYPAGENPDVHRPAGTRDGFEPRSVATLRTTRQPAATLDLTVAGVHLAFNAAPGLTLAPPAFEYPPFLDSRDAVQRIPVRVESKPPPSLPAAARLIFDTDDGWQLLARGADRWLRMPRRDAAGQPGPALWQVSWSGPLREARLWAASEQVHQGILKHVIQYPLDQILITHALLARRALLLHAAGAVTRHGAIAFAGVSGAGKSTITRLLRSTGGLSFLSDDRVVTSPRATGHVLHGTPWAGDARVAESGQAPLSAICFLCQASVPALVALPAAAALERLLPVATLPWFDATAIGDALEAAGDLVSGVPCFDLAFTLDGRATLELLDELPHAV